MTQSSATVVIRNDAVPEGNETFTVEITGARFGAEVGERNTMQLIIRASDEPYGAFQFESVSRLEIKIALRYLQAHLSQMMGKQNTLKQIM